MLQSRGGRTGSEAQPLPAIRLDPVTPARGMVEQGVALVYVALVALDGVAVVAATLGDELGVDEVAADGPDAEEEAADEGGQSGGEDDARLLSLVLFHGWQSLRF